MSEVMNETDASIARVEVPIPVRRDAASQLHGALIELEKYKVGALHALCEQELDRRDVMITNEAAVRRTVHVDYMTRKRLILSDRATMEAEQRADNATKLQSRATVACEEMELTVSRLKADLASTSKKRNELTAESVGLRSEVSSNRDRLQDLESILSTCRDDEAAHLRKIQSLEMELTREKKHTKETHQQLSDLTNDCNQLREAESTLRQKQQIAETRHATELHNATLRLDTMTQQLQQLESSDTTRHNEFLTAKQSAHSTQLEFDLLKRETLEEKHDLQNQIKKLEVDLRISRDHNNFLQKELHNNTIQAILDEEQVFRERTSRVEVEQRYSLSMRCYYTTTRLFQDTDTSISTTMNAVTKSSHDLSELQVAAERIINSQAERDTAVVALRREGEATLDQLTAVLKKKDAALRQITGLLKVQTALQEEVQNLEFSLGQVAGERDTALQLTASTQKDEAREIATEITNLRKILHNSQLKTHEQQHEMALMRKDVEKKNIELTIMSQRCKAALREASHLRKKKQANDRLTNRSVSQQSVGTLTTATTVRKRSQSPVSTSVASTSTSIRRHTESPTPERSPARRSNKKIIRRTISPGGQHPPPSLSLFTEDGSSRIQYLRSLLSDKDSQLRDVRSNLQFSEQQKYSLQEQLSLQISKAASHSPEVEAVSTGVITSPALLLSTPKSGPDVDSLLREKDRLLQQMDMQVTELTTELETIQLTHAELVTAYDVSNERIAEFKKTQETLLHENIKLSEEVVASHGRSSNAVAEIKEILSERTAEKERYNQLLHGVQQKASNATVATAEQLCQLQKANKELTEKLLSLTQQLASSQPLTKPNTLDKDIQTDTTPIERSERSDNNVPFQERVIIKELTNTDQEVLSKAYQSGYDACKIEMSELSNKYEKLIKDRQVRLQRERISERRNASTEYQLNEEIEQLRQQLAKSKQTHLKEVTELRANAERLTARADTRLSKIKELQFHLREFRSLPEPESIVTESSHPHSKRKCPTCGRFAK